MRELDMQKRHDTRHQIDWEWQGWSTPVLQGDCSAEFSSNLC